MALLSDLLISWAMGAARIGAPTRGVGMQVVHQVLLPLVGDDSRYLYASSFCVTVYHWTSLFDFTIEMLRTLAYYNIGLYSCVDNI